MSKTVQGFVIGAVSVSLAYQLTRMWVEAVRTRKTRTLAQAYAHSVALTLGKGRTDS